MRRRAVVIVLAAALPAVLVGNALYVVLHPWFPRAVYGQASFPSAHAIDDPERARLAQLGLRSIQPWETTGIDLLRRVRLETGLLAFRGKELSHMEDVRIRLLGLLALHAAALIALVVLASRRRTREIALSALRWGTVVTLCLGALVGLVLLVNPVGFLTGFHYTVFLSGTSWRFEDEDTLRRIFPDRFWEDTAAVLGIATVAQAALIALLVWRAELRQAIGALPRTASHVLARGRQHRRRTRP